MFDREMINENKEAFFLYVNGRGGVVGSMRDKGG